jgi:hypothetical protein
VRHKLEVLRRHCAAEGRDAAAIEKTVLLTRPPLADLDGAVAEVAQYAALGVTEVQVMPDRHPVAFATEIAEKLLPRLAAIG